MDKVAPVGRGCPRGCPPNRLSNRGQDDATRSRKSGLRAASDVTKTLILKTSSLYNVFIVLVYATTYLSVISAQSVANFNMEGTSYRCSSNMICLGAAHEYAGDFGSSGIEPGRLSLLDNSKQAGLAYYSMPVRLRDTSSGQPASFSTSFTVDVRPYVGSGKQEDVLGGGDGMTFVISANNSFLGDIGSNFGIFDHTTYSTTFKSIVVEFDTWMNGGYPLYDINGNHVSFDFMNVNYVAVGNVDRINIHLNDTSTKYIWVDYSKDTEQLEARVSYNNSRPIIPLLTYSVNLFDHVEELMWVGFSSSSGYSYSNYYIGDWRFESYGIPPRSPVPSPAPAQMGSFESGRPATKGGKITAHKLGVVVAFSAASLAFLLACIILIVVFLRRTSGYRGQLDGAVRKVDALEGMPNRFSYKQLSVATRAFSEETKLGQGGFGSVYGGVLPSGIPVAVKKINSDSTQGEKEFMAEVSIISQLRHRNLIQLQGWCKDASKGQYLLVYELMPNGSLDKVLFESPKSPCLSWSQRFNIVKGTAAALDYLHQGWNQQVIHRDIKPSNIMLDEDWNAKLGDFGLARLVDHQRVAATTGVLGTIGYIAPEAATSGRFTEKTDVFAFGIVALEIACGRKAILLDLPSPECVLVEWVWQNVSEGSLLSTVDQRLEAYDTYWMEVVLKVGLLCSHPNPLARPSMRHVVQGQLLNPDISIEIGMSTSTELRHDSVLQITFSQMLAIFINQSSYAHFGKGSRCLTNNSHAFSTLVTIHSRSWTSAMCSPLRTQRSHPNAPQVCADDPEEDEERQDGLRPLPVKWETGNYNSQASWRFTIITPSVVIGGTGIRCGLVEGLP